MGIVPFTHPFSAPAATDTTENLDFTPPKGSRLKGFTLEIYPSTPLGKANAEVHVERTGVYNVRLAYGTISSMSTNSRLSWIGDLPLDIIPLRFVVVIKNVCADALNINFSGIMEVP